MPYSAEINRTNPTCFLFLIDQSSSMLEPFGGQNDDATLLVIEREIGLRDGEKA